jgi:glycosyltransferase involved in cell wall biosynthesis
MSDKAPFISIIIPTYERNQQLDSCIRSIMDLKYQKHHLEIIVVDDGGDEPVRPILSPYFEKLDLRLLIQKKLGPASARNLGASFANGEYYAFLDDDCAPDPHWLERLLVKASQSRGHAVGGRTVNSLPNNPYSSVSQMIVDCLYGYFNINWNNAKFLTSNNLLVPAKGFDSIRGFDTTMPLAGGEDREFSSRWIARGFSMTFAPEAVVYHYHDLNIFSFWRQHFNYGRGSAMCGRWGIQEIEKERRLKYLAFYLDLLLHPLFRVRHRKALLLFLLMIVSQWATGMGFAWEHFFHSSRSNNR